MNAILAVLALLLGATVALTVRGGAAAVLLCAVFALVAGLIIGRVRDQRQFLLQVFVGGLLMRVLVGTVIYYLGLQEFFGGDAITYDQLAWKMNAGWSGNKAAIDFIETRLRIGVGSGMIYLVASIYAVVGRNMLAVQFFNAVIGAATAPVIFLCARHIFQNVSVGKLAALSVAFYPSLVLWSSQGLKDGPIVFLLALTMLSTLELGDRFSVKYLVVLILAVAAVLTFRFYVFYMVVVAVGGAFLVGMKRQSTRGLVRQVATVVALGLGLTYLGVVRQASSQFETFGSLERVQASRADLARTANSGFGEDVDVSTTGGAITFIPVGMVYLLFAPFPWQVANLRQSITLPEMLIWWGSFPLLVLGIWFTLRYRLRQALPILLFTAMLTLAYSVFQGNVGTAYRQRSQVLVFYFIFVAVGGVLLKERRENRLREGQVARRAAVASWRAAQARRRYDRWKAEQEKGIEDIARDISGRINF